MGDANFLLERRSAVRLARWVSRPVPATAIVLTFLGSLALAVAEPAGSASWLGASRGYWLLTWGEFYLILLLAMIEGGVSIAEERRRGTWDVLCLSRLTNGEIARGKFLGSVLSPALVLLLFVPAHLAHAIRGHAVWDIIAGVQVVLSGTSLAVAGIGVVMSSWTSRALHGVALAAGCVLFPWFAMLDLLARQRVLPTLCRTLHPLRHLEWLLVALPGQPPMLIMARGLGYLAFTGFGAAGAALIVKARLRCSIEDVSVNPWGRARGRPIRTVWDDPILWRECHEPGGRQIVVLVAIAMALMLFSLLASTTSSDWRGIIRTLFERTFGFLVILMLASGVVVGLRCAVTLADERTRQTLEALWLAGIEPTRLIRSKLKAIFRPVWMITACVIFFAAVGYGRLAAPSACFGLAGSVVVVLAYTFLIAALSLACSACAASTRTALLTGLALLVGDTLGTILVGVGAAPFLPESASRLLAAANPIMQLSVVQNAATGHDTGISVSLLLGVLAGEVAVSLAGMAHRPLATGERVQHPESNADRCRFSNPRRGTYNLKAHSTPGQARPVDPREGHSLRP